jgi:hypothetical protein
MDEIHPFLYRFKDIPHDRIYDEIKRTLTIVLKDKMKSMYDANRISESVGISVKRRGIELFKSARDTYPYLYPCDYDRDSYIQSILDAFEDITMGYSLELENMNANEATEFLRMVYGDHFLYHWDMHCGENPITESKKDVDVEKYLDRPLTKLFNSSYVKDVYPMINRVEVFSVDAMDALIVRIFVDDPEINKDNMYRMGLDPHYLIDFHMSKFFPYLNVPKNKKVGYVVMGPDKETIDSFLP